MTDTQKIREAIAQALPLTTSNHGETPDAREVYLPPAHVKALRLECNLVIGARGVGKSFWTAALGSASLRALLKNSVSELEYTDVTTGFAKTENPSEYPDKETFAQLMEGGYTPYEIWRSVVVRWLAVTTKSTFPKEEWSQSVAWVKQNPEPVAKLLQNANNFFLQQQRFGLIVFDALDLTSDNWETMDVIVRDLLRVTLWLKSFTRLHAKVFLREDQAERTVTNFPDASKLLATKAELTWAPHDLHGLLWHMFCNSVGADGECLRGVYEKTLGVAPRSESGVFLISDEVQRDTASQRGLFDVLAGAWMGKDRRRGVPYVWSVSHLADARGRTSPRSFLAAMRQAAEDSLEKYPAHPYALHYESIKRGVQKASEIRVQEMAEDYPWVTRIMDPLKEFTVPCEFATIEAAWIVAFGPVLDASTLNKLPPQHIGRGWEGVHKDLERLGIFETKKDGRINLPDLYRVGFGLGRRGGVKPVK